MDKAKIVKAAVKGSKAQSVKVVNTPTVKLQNDKPEPMPPTLRLSSLNLSAIKNWKVGQTYKLNLDVKMTSLNQGSDYDMIGNDDNATHAGFRVLTVRAS